MATSAPLRISVPIAEKGPESGNRKAAMGFAEAFAENRQVKKKIEPITQQVLFISGPLSSFCFVIFFSPSINAICRS
jgi:hypothetical protein